MNALFLLLFLSGDALAANSRAVLPARFIAPVGLPAIKLGMDQRLPPSAPELAGVLPSRLEFSQAPAKDALAQIGRELAAQKPDSGRPEPRLILERVFDRRWGAAFSAPVNAAASAPTRPLAPSEEKKNPPETPAPPPSGGAPGGGPPWRAWLPNLVTGLNLTSGIGAALLAAQGSLLPACGLILLANFFDLMDGRVARALKVSSPLGVQLDSLADVVSFGAAPALLIYQAALSALGPMGYVIAAGYACAGAFRLARFNLGAANPASAAKGDNFTGLPIPGGAGVLVSFVLALGLIPPIWAAPAAAFLTLATAGAMASTLPYPAFKKGGKSWALPMAVAATATGVLSFFGLYSLIPAALFGLYLLTGPAKAGYNRITSSARR